MFFFFFFPNYFQYLDFKNWNKKLFQVMQLQRKIYWDQLKMCYFCECVKPQKKKKKKAAERCYSGDSLALSSGWHAAPLQAPTRKELAQMGEEEERKQHRARRAWAWTAVHSCSSAVAQSNDRLHSLERGTVIARGFYQILLLQRWQWTGLPVFVSYVWILFWQ